MEKKQWTYHELIEEVSNETQRWQTRRLLITSETFLESHNQSLHNQLANIRKLKT